MCVLDSWRLLNIFSGNKLDSCPYSCYISIYMAWLLIAIFLLKENILFLINMMSTQTHFFSKGYPFPSSMLALTIRLLGLRPIKYFSNLLKWFPIYNLKVEKHLLIIFSSLCFVPQVFRYIWRRYACTRSLMSSVYCISLTDSCDPLQILLVCCEYFAHVFAHKWFYPFPIYMSLWSYNWF